MKLALISTPRSGNTWLRSLLSELYALESYAVHSPLDIHWAGLPERCIYQIHWEPEESFIKQLKAAEFKLLTICRHPLDTLISILHFCRFEPQTASWLDGKGGDESSIIGKTPASNAFLNYSVSERAQRLLSISSQWKQLEECPVIQYEKLVEDPIKELSKLIDIFGHFHCPIKPTIKKYTLTEQRKHSSNNHFWMGTPGIWSSLIDTETANKIYKAHRSIFKTLNYSVTSSNNSKQEPLDKLTNNWKKLSKPSAQRTEPMPPQPLISYAQNFEDVMLWRALGHIKDGFYIDIGAHDPVIDSVSLAFYERGWRGIHVDASLACVERLKAAREDETTIHAAVDKTPGIVAFHSFRDSVRELGISCVNETLANSHAEHGYSYETLTVPAITLDSILDHSTSEDIHWLNIDIEGHETRALQGWVNSQKRPWILIIESNYPLSTTESHQEWEPIITDKGYQFAYYDGLNRYYIHESHSDLINSFTHPPCVFDDFVLSGSATNTLSELTKKQKRDFEIAAQEERELRQDSDNQKAKLEEELSTARTLLRESDNQKAKLEEELSTARTLLRESDNQKATLQKELSILKARIIEENNKLAEEQNLLVISNTEIKRLRTLLYGAPARKHIYRALQVLLKKPHYCQKITSKHKHIKSYKNLNVAWHTHIYRGFRALVEKCDKPWHTHFYRAFQSQNGNAKYAPINTSEDLSIQFKKNKMLSPQYSHSVLEAHKIEMSGMEATDLENYKIHIRTSKETFI